MTDFTFQPDIARNGAKGEDGRQVDVPSGFFTRAAGGMVRDLAADFRAVPGEAWIILAVATVMSNLFIALA